MLGRFRRWIAAGGKPGAKKCRRLRGKGEARHFVNGFLVHPRRFQLLDGRLWHGPVRFKGERVVIVFFSRVSLVYFSGHGTEKVDPARESFQSQATSSPQAPTLNPNPKP